MQLSFRHFSNTTSVLLGMQRKDRGCQVPCNLPLCWKRRRHSLIRLCADTDTRMLECEYFDMMINKIMLLLICAVLWKIIRWSTQLTCTAF